MISRSELSRLDAAQAEVIRRGQGQLRDVFSSLPLNRPEMARDALLEAYPAVVLGHGDLASAVAAEWYEDQRLQQRGGRSGVRDDRRLAVAVRARRAVGLRRAAQWGGLA